MITANETLNKFGVCRFASKVVCIIPDSVPDLAAGLCPDDALNLAAWIIALADGQGKYTFDEIRCKIRREIRNGNVCF